MLLGIGKKFFNISHDRLQELHFEVGHEPLEVFDHVAAPSIGAHDGDVPELGPELVQHQGGIRRVRVRSDGAPIPLVRRIRSAR